MKVIDIKAFRELNNLTQKELADYLGIDKGFISAIEHGKSKFPKAKLTLLLNNPHNWDISMLVQPENPMTDEPKEDAFIAHLKQEIADLKATIERLQNERCDLREEIGTLKKEVQLARKGEIASIVVGSSDADTV